MQLRLLGPMAVIRDDGEPLPLPASRKTRALLGYLAADGQPVRRDRLCHLFWEVPDDPKGALRWSLSKLRGVLGEAIVADRETAALDPRRIDIDFIDLRDAAKSDLAAASATRSSSRLLPRSRRVPRASTCPIATISTPGGSPSPRMSTAGSTRVCRRAGRAATSPPDRLLPHVRAWVEREPHRSRPPTKRWCRLLRAAGRDGEAEQQRAPRHPPPRRRRPARQRRAARESARQPAETRSRTADAGHPLLHRQRRHELAYSVTGDGPPLVKAANWLNHLEAGFRQPGVAPLDPGAAPRSAACGAMTSAATACPTGTRR